MQSSLLGRLREELDGAEGEEFAEAAQRLAEDFGAVAATAVNAAYERARAQAAEAARTEAEAEAGGPAGNGTAAAEPEADPEATALESLFHPGHMRRRLEQLVETHKRYGHPFALVVFDASGPETRNGEGAAGQETVLSVIGAALRQEIRIVDEVYLLEEDALCVLAPNLRTVEGVQMAERLLRALEELERAGGMRIAISAGVVACPEHGAKADLLLHKADAAMWRARAVGQPVGVGALESSGDR